MENPVSVIVIEDELGVVQRRLETLNVSVEGLEAGVDCMYRCLDVIMFHVKETYLTLQV